jgi:hypothetical protein
LAVFPFTVHGTDAFDVVTDVVTVVRAKVLLLGPDAGSKTLCSVEQFAKGGFGAGHDHSFSALT